MKMIDTETGHEMVEVSGHDKKEYASKIVSKANTINGVTIGEGSIKLTIPFINKTIVFDKEDFDELKTNIEKYGKLKQTDKPL